MPTETYVFSQDSEFKLGFLEVHLGNPRPERQSRHCLVLAVSRARHFSEIHRGIQQKRLEKRRLFSTVAGAAGHPWTSSTLGILLTSCFSTNTQTSLESPGLEVPPLRHTQGPPNPSTSPLRAKTPVSPGYMVQRHTGESGWERVGGKFYYGVP